MNDTREDSNTLTVRVRVLGVWDQPDLPDFRATLLDIPSHSASHARFARYSGGRSVVFASISQSQPLDEISDDLKLISEH